MQEREVLKMYDNNENLSGNDTGISGIGDSPGDLMEAPETVSSGDPDLQVSSGDPPMLSILQVVPEADTPDMAETLTHIDTTLSVILFLLLFDFCFRRIRNAVKLFVGRSHYE